MLSMRPRPCKTKKPLKRKYAGSLTTKKHMQHVTKLLSHARGLARRVISHRKCPFLFFWGRRLQIKGSCHPPHILIFYLRRAKNYLYVRTFMFLDCIAVLVGETWRMKKAKNIFAQLRWVVI